MLSLFPFCHGNVYLFSLCVASQSEIKITPNRIHVLVFVWRRPGFLAGSTFALGGQAFYWTGILSSVLIPRPEQTLIPLEMPLNENCVPWCLGPLCKTTTFTGMPMSLVNCLSVHLPPSPAARGDLMLGNISSSRMHRYSALKGLQESWD